MTGAHKAGAQALLLLIFLLSVWWTSSAQAQVQAQVYRCGNAYSEAPCANARSVDVSPQVSYPGGPRTTLIHLCKQPDNRLAWHVAPCSASGMALERSERVPVQLDWAQQVAFANRRYAQALATMAAPAPVRQSTPRGPNRQTQCRALEERVRQLDSMGRAGSQYYDLEWVRSERKKTRDAQFRLQCR